VRAGLARRGERGAALVMALLALMVLTLLGLALTSMSLTSLSAANSERDANLAFYAAEAGLAHGLGLLEASPAGSFDALLRAADGVPCNGDELAGAVPGFPGFPTADERIETTGRAFPPAIGYRVALCDDHAVESTAAGPGLPDTNAAHDANQRILIRSTATARGGASATIEAVATRLSLPGLLVDGPLRITGNVALRGAGGAVHANGDLDLSGTPCAELFFSSSGLAVAGGAVQGGAGCASGSADVRSGQPRIPPPALAPQSLRARADFILGADGFIRLPEGGVVTVPGWSWDSGNRRWSGGGNIGPGTYYAEGNVDLSGNPGAGGHGGGPLSLTLIAEGWVDVTGTPNLAPALVGPPAYSIVAGTDLRIAGNPGTTYQGLFYAGDQVDFSGNPTVVGQVIAANRGDLGHPADPDRPALGNLVLRQDGYISLSGNVTIVYDGGSGLSGTGLADWRECRGPDPDAPCDP
jgi:hypothetical protein